jgi:NADH-quinone oxidoreductase subunit N
VRAPTEAPTIDWTAISPLLALVGGLCLVLMVGLLRAPFVRTKLVPFLALVALGTTAGLAIWTWGDNVSVLEGALRMDDLTLALTMVFVTGAAAAVLLELRGTASEDAGHGEFYTLLLTAVLGMVVLSGSTNLVTVFIGYELLSIPLYVMCATHLRREHSLESGLKYLIIGSVGSATLLYGLAFVYGATGSTDFSGIDQALRNGSGLGEDVLFLTGLGFVLVGLAFKASVAPFHQWTPDVYEGAPTPVTAFMAVATKAAALGVILRLFDVALISTASTWAPALATLAAITIVVGNVGAIGQSSIKRMLAYSSVAQAGYMLAGVVVSTSLGVKATIFYIAVYAFMNLAAFAVVVARERETTREDDITALYGLGNDRPWLAWPMTIAMLALAGFPATAGFFGKIYLIDAAVDNGYAWLGVLIVLGSAISLAYYLRVVAAVWMRSPDEAPEPPAAIAARPAMAGGSAEADSDPDARAAEARLARREGAEVMRGRAVARAGLQLEVLFVAVVCAAATIFFGVYPDPLLDFAGKAGAALSNLL